MSAAAQTPGIDGLRPSGAERDYRAVADRVRAASGDAGREGRMKVVVDALWDGLHDKGVSWVGFYVADESAPEEQRLVLGPRRDKPACSPIGLHGVCGQGYLGRCVRIVEDVQALGGNYIACDPRDRSEIVLPIIEDDRCVGVLDVDSWDVGAFTERDEEGLRKVLAAAGFRTG